jgi:nucleoid-associated protein YgaU
VVLKRICQLFQCCFILLFVTACAAQIPQLKDEAALAVQNVMLSKLETAFPAETEDFYRAVHKGDVAFGMGNVQQADLYYSLALGKVEILETRYLQVLKKREESARLEFELKRQAEAEIERQKKVEQERLAREAREAAHRKKIAAEKAEARLKAERDRQEKDVKTETRHTVKRGETLPQIAALQEVYGESSLWPLIYKANRDQISNPAILWPGQVLRIPRNADKNDLAEARRFAAYRLLR